MTSLLTSKLAEIKKRSEATTYDGQILLVQLKADIPFLLGALDEAVELLLDVFNQACQICWDNEKNRAVYDHMCLSAYEHAQDKLIELGIISEDQCRRK